MPGVVRVDLDKHNGHASPTPSPFHRSAYKNANQSKVYAHGKLVVVKGGSTTCGDPADGASEKVFAMGIGVHRKTDATSGHGSFVPNAAATGSNKVYADGD